MRTVMEGSDKAASAYGAVVGLLQGIVKEYPQARFLYGIVGLAAVITVVLVFLRPEQAVFGAVAVLLAGVALGVAGRAARAGTPAAHRAATLLIYGATTLLLVWGLALSFIYLWPRIVAALAGPHHEPSSSVHGATPEPSGSARAPIEGNGNVRVIYYRLKGRAVDQFVRGKFRIGGGSPVIVADTSTVSMLRGALKTASTKVSYDDCDLGFTRSGAHEEEEGVANDEANDLKQGPQFRETGTADCFRSAQYSATLSEAKLHEILATGDWHVRVPSGTDDSIGMQDWEAGDPPYFWRYADHALLAQLPVPLFQQLASTNLPPHMLVMTVFGESGIASCPGRSRDLVLAAPSRTLELEVAVLENIATRPVELGEFELHEGSRSDLRDATDDEKDIQQTSSTRRLLYPPRQLKPGEKIGVLLRGALRYPQSPGPLARRLLDAKPTQVAGPHLLLPPQPEYVADMKRRFGITLSAKEVSESIHRISATLSSVAGLEDPDFASTIVAGHTIHLGGIEVDRVWYSIREETDENVAFIQQGLTGATCPHVYSHGAHDVWEFETAILVGVVGAQNEAESSVTLSHFDGRVLLREEEDETTFLDDVHVEIGSEPNTRKLWPSQPALQSRDGRRLALKKGEEVVLSFSPPMLKTRARLVAYGYYEPVVANSAARVTSRPAWLRAMRR